MQELREAIHIIHMRGKSTWMWDAIYPISALLDDAKTAISMILEPLLGSPTIPIHADCQTSKVIGL